MTKFAGLFAIALLGMACHKSESPHVKRAKDLISIGEWANATTELKLELKDHPHETDARGMLMYCLDRDPGISKIVDASLMELYQVLTLSSSPGWKDLPQDGRDRVQKALISVRQALYDKGIDTADPSDLRKVVIATARFGFDKDDDDSRKESYAAILAAGGTDRALDYLIDRLKSQNPATAVDALEQVGKPAVPALRKAIQDRSFMGRGAGLEALSHILGEAVAREFVADSNGLRDPEDHDPPIPGATKLGPSYLEPKLDPTPLRSHAQYVACNCTADGVLLVQSWNEPHKQMNVRVYALRDGEMQRLRVTKDGSSFDLGGPSAVFALAEAGGTLTVRRVVQHVSTRAVETGRVSSPAVGMRVHLQGYAPAGKIVRQDGGLWVVHVEQPIEGMTELTVASSALIGIRDEPFTETSIEQLSAKLDGAELTITGDDVEHGMAAALEKMADFRDEMCKCTDAACAQHVSEEMTAWSQDIQSRSREPVKPTDAEASQMTDLTKALTDCMTKAMGADSD